MLVDVAPTGTAGVVGVGVGATTTTELMTDGVAAGGAGGGLLATGVPKDGGGAGA